MKNVLKEKWDISENGIAAFLGSLILGMWAHGFMFANKLSFHDDMWCMKEFGSTLHSERWFLWILEILGIKCSINISSSWYNGILALVLLALSALILVEILKINDLLLAILIAGIITVFPAIAATYAYMFTAWQYALGILFASIAVWIINADKGILRIIFGAIFLSMSLGIYQAYISVFTAVSVLSLIKIVFEEKNSVRVFKVKSIEFFLTGVLAILMYFCMNKILSWKLNVSSTYSERNINNIFNSFVASYKAFIDYLTMDFLGMNTFIGIKILTIFIVILCIVLSFGIFLRKEIDIINKIILSVLFVVFPISINFVCVVTLNDVKLHSLMVYGLCYLYVLPCVLFDRFVKIVRKHRVIYNMLVVGLLGIVILFIKLDNVAYLKCNFVKEQTTTYYTTLLSRIQSLEGYNDEYKVAFVNIENARDNTMADLNDFQVELTAAEGNMQDVISGYSYKNYLKYYLGYTPIWVEENELQKIKNSIEVKEMDTFPRDGSIRIIENTIVVKF